MNDILIYVKDEILNLIAPYFATALVLIVFLANNFCIHYGVYKGLWDLYGNINVLSTYFLLQIWYLHTSHLLLVIKTTHAAM